MDNKKIFLQAESKEDFAAGMQIAFSSAPGGQAKGYCLVEEKGLAFLWHYENIWQSKPFSWRLREARHYWIVADGTVSNLDGKHSSIEKGAEVYGRVADDEDIVVESIIQKVPYKMELKQAIDFGWNWLHGAADYSKGAGRLDDPDVSEHKGFVLETDHWGHVWDNHYGIVGIRPAWAWYGK